jgi:sigma-B regulation protein RsbU (phosphoserine phosphatase)
MWVTELGLTIEDTKRRFVNLLKINEALTAETDFEVLLNLIVSKSSELLDAERATLYLLDVEKGELWSKIAEGMTQEKKVIRLPLGQGIAGYVASTGEIVNLEDAYLDRRFDPSNDFNNGFRTRSMLAVPLRDRQNHIVGVLQVINRERGTGPFTHDDEELLTALSSTAAIAIHNARLIEEVQEKERIKAELEIASEIQRNLLPSVMPEIPNLDLYAYCRPSREMNGDYYNVIDFGNKIGMIIADVCGKSVPAAFLMALAHNTVRMAMHRTQQPREMLRQANHWLVNQMGDRYVAVTYLMIDLQKQRFVVSNAGQPTYPILVRQGYCFPVELGGIPLGLEDDIEYRQTGRGLRPGDLVLLYTDGIVEAVGPDREIFSFERLHAVARTCTGLTARQAVERIVEAVDSYVYPCEQSDDITIMAFRVL